VYFFTSISSKNIIPKTKRERERERGEGGEGRSEKEGRMERGDESSRYIDPRNPLSNTFFSGNKAFPNFDPKSLGAPVRLFSLAKRISQNILSHTGARSLPVTLTQLREGKKIKTATRDAKSH